LVAEAETAERRPDVPPDILARYLLLPELRLVKGEKPDGGGVFFFAEKTSSVEVCPRCATPSSSVYDRRWVTLRDDPLRGAETLLVVRKRRFQCGTCQRPFTEPIAGVRKGYRTTERYRRRLLWACEHFSDLKDVCRAFHCSSALLYRVVYEQLALRQRMHVSPWPKKVGIDEHFFKRNLRSNDRERQFVTMVVDQKNHRLKEVVNSRKGDELEAALAHIPERENVEWVSIDMSDSYRSFVRRFFPNASIVADKFHVLRLITPAINRHRRAIAGDRDSVYLRRLLLRNGRDLAPWWRSRLRRWLETQPVLRELYEAKEALHRFYRIRGPGRARRALTALTDAMAHSQLPELRTLRGTLLRWRKEVLAYFRSRLTNARVEGFNGKAKLVKRRAYGYKSFENYRLRLLSACS
jgi:transposase